jgi:hypothetical protein
MLPRHRVRAGLPIIGPSGPTTCLVRSCQPIGDRDFGHAIRSIGPCKPALDLYGSMPSCAQPCIRAQLSQSLKARFSRCFLRRQRGWWSSNRRNFTSRRHDRRLAGIELNFLRPFALGFDPDRRRRDQLRAIGENRRRRGTIPADYQEQSSKRASDKHKIPGHGHSPSLLQIAKFGFAHDRNLIPGPARDTLLVRRFPGSFRSGHGFARRAPPALNRGPFHRLVQTRSLAASPRSCFRLSH